MGFSPSESTRCEIASNSLMDNCLVPDVLGLFAYALIVFESAPDPGLPVARARLRDLPNLILRASHSRPPIPIKAEDKSAELIVIIKHRQALRDYSLDQEGSRQPHVWRPGWERWITWDHRSRRNQ